MEMILDKNFELMDSPVSLPMGFSGCSPEATFLRSQFFAHLAHIAATFSIAPAFQRFNTLASTWREDTRFLSSISNIVMHPAYQEIIGMGEEALPLILRDLKANPDHWFWALKAITGIDPVPPKDRGNIRKMAMGWIKWGEQNGHIQRSTF